MLFYSILYFSILFYVALLKISWQGYYHCYNVLVMYGFYLPYITNLINFSFHRRQKCWRFLFIIQRNLPLIALNRLMTWSKNIAWQISILWYHLLRNIWFLIFSFLYITLVKSYLRHHSCFLMAFFLLWTSCLYLLQYYEAVYLFLLQAGQYLITI